MYEKFIWHFNLKIIGKVYLADLEVDSRTILTETTGGFLLKYK
jgi:hypothetical protein